MSTTSRSRSLVFGLATLFTLTLLAPLVVTAEKEVAALAPVTTPTVDGTGAYAVQAARAIAAQQALLSPGLGTMQEDTLTAMVPATSAEARGGRSERR